MKFSITVRSWWLLAFSLVLAAGAVYVIVLDDWRHGAELSADHGMFLLLFLAVLLAGLFIGPAWGAGKYVSSFVLVLVTICATGLLTAESAGRVAKAGFAAEAVANKDAGQLKGALSDLKNARTALADANANFARECGTGKGARCKGLKEAVDTLEMQFYKAQTRVDNIKPAAPANGTAAYFAAWGDVLGSSDSARWGKAYVLAAPLGKVITFDICILALLHLALGVALVSDKMKTEGHGGGQKLLPSPRQEVLVEDPVVLALRKAKRPVTNDELADLLNVSKGQASKLVAAREGMLRKERAGRTVAISLAQVH